MMLVAEGFRCLFEGPLDNFRSKCIFFVAKNYLWGLVEHILKDFDHASTGTPTKSGVSVAVPQSKLGNFFFFQPILMTFGSKQSFGHLKPIVRSNFRNFQKKYSMGGGQSKIYKKILSDFDKKYEKLSERKKDAIQMKKFYQAYYIEFQESFDNK